MNSSLIMQQARDVLEHAQKIVQFLSKNGLQEPDFTSTSAAHPLNRDYDAMCIELTEAAQDLILLANGPMKWVRTFFCHHHDLAAWQTALRFDFFMIVPLEMPASVTEIAAIAKMDEDRLGRVMKLLASQRCFQEVEENVYEHTSLSAFIAKHRDIKAAMAFQVDEMFEAASLTATSIEKAPYTSDAAHSAFNLRFGTSPYMWYTANPERGQRFASAMAGLGQVNRDTTEIRDRFPWAELNGKTIVDVGGGSGHISIYLATQFPDLKFIVQDVNPNMLAQGPKRPEFASVEDRVSFMQYDFFQPQPITDAGLFFLRQIAHNYADDVCVSIFKSFIPALEKSPAGVGILINDMLMPAMNTKPKVEEHHLRQLDIAMMNGYAAKQRSLQEFTNVLQRADQRYKIIKVHGEGVMGLIEVRLEGLKDE